MSASLKSLHRLLKDVLVELELGRWLISRGTFPLAGLGASVLHRHDGLGCFFSILQVTKGSHPPGHPLLGLLGRAFVGGGH